MKIESLETQLQPFFEERPEIIFAYLFGSLARGEGNSLSDIDIAIATDPKKMSESDHLYGYLSTFTSLLMSVLQNNRIDVVHLNQASPALKHRVFSQGARIFSRNSEAEKLAYLRAFHEYQDTAPLRKIQQYYLKRYLKSLGPARFSSD